MKTYLALVTMFDSMLLAVMVSKHTNIKVLFNLYRVYSCSKQGNMEQSDNQPTTFSEQKDLKWLQRP